MPAAASPLSDAWLYSVAGVGVGTTCVAVWLKESEDLIVHEEYPRPNERQYLKFNVKCSSVSPNSR